jgi:hypothetical protein
VRGRRFKPVELVEVCDASGVQLKRGRGEIGAKNFRHVVFRTRGEILRGVESERAPGAHAACSPRALHG